MADVKATRRGLFALGGVTSLATIAPPTPPEIDWWGLRVSLSWRYGEWTVAVPIETDKWYPGIPPAVEHIPLSEFLARVEKECGIQSAKA